MRNSFYFFLNRLFFNVCLFKIDMMMYIFIKSFSPHPLLENHWQKSMVLVKSMKKNEQQKWKKFAFWCTIFHSTPPPHTNKNIFPRWDGGGGVILKNKHPLPFLPNPFFSSSCTWSCFYTTCLMNNVIYIKINIFKMNKYQEKVL